MPICPPYRFSIQITNPGMASTSDSTNVESTPTSLSCPPTSPNQSPDPITVSFQCKVFLGMCSLSLQGVKTQLIQLQVCSSGLLTGRLLLETFTYKCVHVFSFLLSEFRDGMVDCVDKCILNSINCQIKKIAKLFPSVITVFCVPVSSVWELNCFASTQHFVCLVFSIWPLQWVCRYSIMILIFISLFSSIVKYLLICWYTFICLWWSDFKSFAHILIVLFVLYIVLE